jgi:hypothetical protein
VLIRIHEDSENNYSVSYEYKKDGYVISQEFSQLDRHASEETVTKIAKQYIKECGKNPNLEYSFHGNAD